VIVGPLAASCGVTIAKMSGRGLGYSGGTIDKLESIPGFQVQLTPAAFLHAVKTAGMSIIGQTRDVAPADKKLYAIRDVTATVDNVSLIAGSIMSKKLSSGSDAIILDVKCGSGAFMKTQVAAGELGSLMVEIGNRAGKKDHCACHRYEPALGLCGRQQPGGHRGLRDTAGKRSKGYRGIIPRIGRLYDYMGGKAESPQKGQAMAREALLNGAGFDRMKRFVEAQGGDSRVLSDYSMMKQPAFSESCTADSDGYISKIAADSIGRASQHLGAGRRTKEDVIDLSAGIVLLKKLGDPVKKGEILATLYSDDKLKLQNGLNEAKAAFKIADRQTPVPKLIKKIIE
jgi:pyrimidine-nucleoside phosphorylase